MKNILANIQAFASNQTAKNILAVCIFLLFALMMTLSTITATYFVVIIFMGIVMMLLFAYCLVWAICQLLSNIK